MESGAEKEAAPQNLSQSSGSGMSQSVPGAGIIDLTLRLAPLTVPQRAPQPSESSQGENPGSLLRANLQRMVNESAATNADGVGVSDSIVTKDALMLKLKQIENMSVTKSHSSTEGADIQATVKPFLEQLVIDRILTSIQAYTGTRAEGTRCAQMRPLLQQIMVRSVTGVPSTGSSSSTMDTFSMRAAWLADVHVDSIHRYVSSRVDSLLAETASTLSEIVLVLFQPSSSKGLGLELGVASRKFDSEKKCDPQIGVTSTTELVPETTQATPRAAQGTRWSPAAKRALVAAYWKHSEKGRKVVSWDEILIDVEFKDHWGTRNITALKSQYQKLSREFIAAITEELAAKELAAGRVTGGSDSPSQSPCFLFPDQSGQEPALESGAPNLGSKAAEGSVPLVASENQLRTELKQMVDRAFADAVAFAGTSIQILLLDAQEVPKESA